MFNIGKSGYSALFRDIQTNPFVQQKYGGNPDDGIISRGELGAFIDNLKNKTTKTLFDVLHLSNAESLQQDFDKIDQYGATNLNGIKGDNLIHINEATAYAGKPVYGTRNPFLSSDKPEIPTLSFPLFNPLGDQPFVTPVKGQQSSFKSLGFPNSDETRSPFVGLTSFLA
jgi:hypothetical protein